MSQLASLSLRARNVHPYLSLRSFQKRKVRLAAVLNSSTEGVATCVARSRDALTLLKYYDFLTMRSGVSHCVTPKATAKVKTGMLPFQARLTSSCGSIQLDSSDAPKSDVVWPTAHEMQPVLPL